VAALRQALKEGVIDCIATDHAPHNASGESARIHQRSPGMIGLETLAFDIDRLVKTGVLTLSEMILRMSDAPARLFHCRGEHWTRLQRRHRYFDPTPADFFTHFGVAARIAFSWLATFRGVEKRWSVAKTVFERSESSAKPHPSPL